MQKEFWENRWTTGQTGWDLGAVSPPLKKYFDALPDKSIRILIPGCGNAYEAEYLMRLGFTQVYIVEIAEGAIDSFCKRCPEFPKSHIIAGDFFELDDQFDLIVEQTFFCAISPDKRDEYVIQMYKLLKPGGKLVGLLFNRTFEGGPPFGGSIDEYQIRFAPLFSPLSIEKTTDSAAPRAGTEVFLEAVKSRDKDL